MSQYVIIRKQLQKKVQGKRIRSAHEYLQKKEFINRQVYFYVKGKCTNELKYKIRENDAVQN